jgi:hypothetical protein
MTESITRFMTCRQQENESLTDYVKRLNSNRDGLAQTMGKDFLRKFLENTRECQDEPDADKQKAMYDDTAYPKMDSIYVNEEQPPTKVWNADDRFDNSVLNGCENVPRKRCKGH